MVEYRCAEDAEGRLVEAIALRGEDQSGRLYSCLACRKRLIARVNGEKKRPHFAHYAGDTCSPETYLHKLGKQLFAEVFTHAVEEGTPFEIELSTLPTCDRYESLLGTKCRILEPIAQRHDLTALYDQVQIETRDGQFIPDVSLTDSNGKNPPIFIEIAVTHFLSGKKSASANKIIELTVSSEDDLQCIRDRLISEENAAFLNFHPRQSVPDSQCVCHNRVFYMFMVYGQSGKSFCDDFTLREALKFWHQRHAALMYWELIPTRESPYAKQDLVPEPNAAFRDGVANAESNGIPIKNCFLCQYHAQKYDRNKEGSVFCKVFKKTCNTNTAVNCSAFKRGQPRDPRR